MATLTIRNLPEKVVERVKTIAEQNGHSMEKEIRELIQERFAQKGEVLARMKKRWQQRLVPSAKQVNQWIESGRR